MAAHPPRQLDLFGPPPAAEAERPAGLVKLRSPEPRATPEPDDLGAAALAADLGRRLASGLASLVLTDNRSRIVSARPAKSSAGLEVRIHRCFVGAPPPVLDAVALFLTSRRAGAARRKALTTIREHFRRHGETSASPRRRLILRPVGHAYDLRELRDALNREYFGGELEVHVTWGRARGRRRRRRRGCGFSILLGTYDERRNLVRIHRCLDRAEVPRYVVESVVYHEMLHAAVPAIVSGGRRRIHTPEFRRRERLYRRFEEASRWIESHLEQLAGWR